MNSNVEYIKCIRSLTCIIGETLLVWVSQQEPISCFTSYHNEMAHFMVNADSITYGIADGALNKLSVLKENK